MAPRVKKHLSDIEIDEISLVDRGANQHAAVTIAKRAPEEEDMPELYDEEGNLLGDDYELQEGDIVYDGDGQAYEYVLEDENEEAEEPELVGKAAEYTNAGRRVHQGAESPEEKELGHIGRAKNVNPRYLGGRTVQGQMSRQESVGVGKSFRDEVMEELSKAYSDEERDKVIAKAFDQVETYSKQAEEAEEIAKAERDLRLTREYVSKAAEYNVPIAPEDLGPVLYRMAETMDYDDCAVIHKALESAGAAIFDEIGHIGGGDNTDVMSQVSAYLNEHVSKNTDIDEAELVAKTFDANPDAYDQYLAEQRGY